MNVATTKPAAAMQVTPAPVPVRQAEPKTGGSYTRNLVTGALAKSAAPATQPAKE